MSVSATSTVSNTSAADQANTALRVPQKTLGQDDFLKLLTVQLAKQDPMKPMEDTAFIAQMAQFSSLQQSTEMAKQMASMQSDNALQTASSLLGRAVTLASEDGNVTGAVDSVENTNGTVSLSVGGKLYTLSQILRVAPAVVDSAS